jgi:hypothetical protein
MTRGVQAAVPIAATAMVCAAMLWLPGRTITAGFINDVLIFVDGAHRIAVGQVPNRDFHSALGPLVFYLPALGYWLSGSFGAAMPVGMAILLIGFLPAMIRILQSRLSPFLAVVLGALLIVILAAPINLGSPVTLLTFAMFYNRIGWAALALLLVMYLQPAQQTARSRLLDALAASFLLLVQIYTKATYGVVGLGFVVILLLDGRQRRWAMMSLVLTAIVMITIELAWGGSRQHLTDLMATANVSGGRDVASLIRNMLDNLSDLTLFWLVAGIAAWQARSIADLLFYGFCFVAGLLILNQNAHGWGIITLYSGVAIAVERTVRLASVEKHTRVPARLVPGLPMLVLFFFLPPIAHYGAALTLHSALAGADAGEPLGPPLFDDLRNFEPPEGQPRFMMQYVASIKSGGDLLQSLGVDLERVLVLDFVNPFSAGLNIRPPSGDSSWLHWKRNIDEQNHPPAEVLFADVKIVMIPKPGINGLPLRDLYGSYILREFQLIKETSEWTVYLRRQAGG